MEEMDPGRESEEVDFSKERLKNQQRPPVVTPEILSLEITACLPLHAALRREPESGLFLAGILVRGKLLAGHGKQGVEIDKGDLWGTGPGDWALADIAGDSDGIAVILRGGFVEPLLRYWGLAPDKPRTPARFAHRSYLLLQQIQHVFESARPINPLTVLTRFLRIAEYQTRSMPAVSDERAGQIVELIAESWKFDPFLSVAQIARRLGVSVTTLRSSCYRVRCQSTHGFLETLRRDRAKELLYATADKISYVAHQTGFNDEKYFLTWFRKAEGLSPGEWRKRIKP